LQFDASIPVALLFIAAMLCFFLGLVWFLREIDLATNTRSGLGSGGPARSFPAEAQQPEEKVPPSPWVDAERRIAGRIRQTGANSITT
jgi:hypothetical protein